MKEATVQKLHPAPVSSPNEWHIGEDGVSLEAGLKETAHRVLPSAEQTRAKLEELDQRSEALVRAEAGIQERVDAAKAELEAAEAVLRAEREEFEREREEFRIAAAKKSGGRNG